MGFCSQSQYSSLTPTWPHLQEIIKYSILMWADKWRQPFFGSIHWKDVALFRHTYSPERNMWFPFNKAMWRRLVVPSNPNESNSVNFQKHSEKPSLLALFPTTLLWQFSLKLLMCFVATSLSVKTKTTKKGRDIKKRVYTHGFNSNKSMCASEFGASVYTVVLTCSSFVTEVVQKAAACTFPAIFRASHRRNWFIFKNYKSPNHATYKYKYSIGSQFTGEQGICRMQPGHIKGKYQLHSRGLSAHILTGLTLSSAPNSNISTAPKSSGRWKFWVKLHHGQWGPTALNKKAC